MSDIGKFICYGSDSGNFMWAKIVGETTVNRIDGPKDVFIVKGRIVGIAKADGSINSRTIDIRTTVEKDSLNLETDLFEAEPNIVDFSDEELFLFVLSRDLTNLSHRFNVGQVNFLIQNIKTENGKSGLDKIEAACSCELKQRMRKRE